MQALDVDFAADDGEGLDDVFAFGHDGLPGLGHDAGIGAEDAAVRRAVVGADVPGALGVDRRRSASRAPRRELRRANRAW